MVDCNEYIQEDQLYLAKEKNLDRLAKYLGIDTTGLEKDQIIQIVFRRLIFNNGRTTQLAMGPV
jgi:hypothetical protein